MVTIMRIPQNPVISALLHSTVNDLEDLQLTTCTSSHSLAFMNLSPLKIGFSSINCMIKTYCGSMNKLDFFLVLLSQSGPQDQKSVIFSHSVISLNQLL